MNNDNEEVRSSQVVIIYIIVDSAEEADEIGVSLVNNKLVACVNIIPQISSIYQWKGQVERGSETLIFAKTVWGKVDAVIRMVTEIHSYEVPCIEVIEVQGGYTGYLDYVKKEVS